MPSKRSKQHARRRVARRVAETLSGSRDASGNPIYRIVEQRMQSAYMTLDAHLAMALYLGDPRQ